MMAHVEIASELTMIEKLESNDAASPAVKGAMIFARALID